MLRKSLTLAALPIDPTPIDAPLNIGRSYGGGWMGEAYVMEGTFVSPEDLLRESYANPRPQSHVVRVDAIKFDDAVWPMFGDRFGFPIGAAMAEGRMEPLDDYRLIYDGAHA